MTNEELLAKANAELAALAGPVRCKECGDELMVEDVLDHPCVDRVLLPVEKRLLREKMQHD